jgi:formylglycine-generating enzyme required for sulfatase activity
MKKLIFTAGFIALMSGAALNAQVTIGQDKSPEPFSVLELISNNARGLRLPQLSTQQRDDIATANGTKPTMMGLQIFNIDTECVETWNGITWIQACYNNTPTVSPVPTSCGITPNGGNNTVYTAKPDPNATMYQFYVNGASQGKQSGNVLMLPTLTDASQITVAYYYPSSYLKPTMISVTGNGSSNWKYGSSNTPTDKTIPTLQWSETPITQAQFEYVMEENPAYFRCGGIGNYSVSCRPTSALPVENVNWYDAIAYCNKLSLKEGKTPCYSVKDASSNEIDWANIAYSQIPTSDDIYWNATTCNFKAGGYRLPTESEWEYAARGGTLTNNYIYSGSNTVDDVAWYGGNNGSNGVCTVGDPYYGTKPVKTKNHNELGLYDMSGNVLEWCWNWYEAIEGFPASTPDDETGIASGEGSYPQRILRGGIWVSGYNDCRVSIRSRNSPYIRDYTFGFRVVCK